MKYKLLDLKGVPPYRMKCGGMTLNIWWYLTESYKTMIIIYGITGNNIRKEEFSLLKLKDGIKALSWIRETQKVSAHHFKLIKQEIIDKVLTNKAYRLDNLD